MATMIATAAKVILDTIIANAGDQAEDRAIRLVDHVPGDVILNEAAVNEAINQQVRNTLSPHATHVANNPTTGTITLHFDGGCLVGQGRDWQLVTGTPF